MPSGYEIIWSNRAKIDLDQRIQWLIENRSEKQLRNFVQALDKRINLIQMNPNLFPVSIKKSGIHKSVMKFHITLFYKVEGCKVQIITLFDARQNPKKAIGN
jgi:plasmid stabilization system protein ParE